MDEKMDGLKKRQKLASKKLVLPSHVRLCPFQSSPDEEVACTPKCAIYRQKAVPGFNCPLIELTSIGWTLKGSPNKKQERNYGQYQAQ